MRAKKLEHNLVSSLGSHNSLNSIYKYKVIPKIYPTQQL
jgi:hypothetical protein